MNRTATPEYRAKLVINDQITCTLTGTDLKAVQEVVQKVYQTGQPTTLRNFPLHFERVGTSLFIYTESYHNGTEPIGWITECEVPEQLGVRAILETRKLQAA